MMKIINIISFFLFTLLFTFCGAGEENEQSEKVTDEMHELQVGFSDPSSVVQVIFDAAATEDFEILSEICDPLGDNDGDTRDICSCGKEDVDKELLKSFVEYFAKGKVVSTSIEGDWAKVEFKFGPNGNKDETMSLVKRDGKWYLSGF